MQRKKLRKQLLVLPDTRIAVLLGITSIAMIIIGILCVNKSQIVGESRPAVANSKPIIPTVNALGKLEPKGEVVKVTASSSGANVSKVAKLLVEEGDQVEEGQLIAILESRDRLQASLAEAKKKVGVSESHLAQVEVGAKKGEITALRATVNRLQAELKGEIEVQKATINHLESELAGQKQALKATINRQKAEKDHAVVDLKRYDDLFKQGAISAQELDAKRLKAETSTEQVVESKADRNTKIATLEQQVFEAKANRDRAIATLQQQINEAKGNLNKTLEIAPTDIAQTQAEVDGALATAKRLKAELNSGYIRTPEAGQILSVKTRPGETVSDEGIVELGQTDQMYVVAEVYESDIGKIRPGQIATITSPKNVFNGKLQGKVEHIALEIGKKDILDSDPTAATDPRVIEVQIRLDEKASQKVSALTNLQVDVEIRSGN